MVEAAPVKADGCEQFRPLIERYDWDIDVAMAVMKAESSCNPRAYNGTMNKDGSNDAGLFQVNSIHDATSARFNPTHNIALAHRIYKSRAKWDSSGWKAWSVFNNGRYLQFMRAQ